jgi:hypothetical protein
VTAFVERWSSFPSSRQLRRATHVRTQLRGNMTINWRAARLRSLGSIACGAVLVACSSGADRSSVEVEPLPDICSPLGFGGGVGWATSCDGGTVVNVDTGEEHILHCAMDDTPANVEDIVAIKSDTVVLFGCDAQSSGSATTMVQSLVSQPHEAAVDMGFPADIKAAAFAAVESGSIIILTGKCNGLLAYQLESADSLEGKAIPISSIAMGDTDFELDGGRSYATAPPCTDLSATRGLGATTDGSMLALGLVGPDSASIYERAVDVFVGTVTYELTDRGLTLRADMAKVASGLDDLATAIGVADCDGIPTLVVAGDGRLSALAGGRMTALSLRPANEWGGLALSDDGRSLLAETEVPFEPGLIYRTDNLDICR